MSFSEEKKLLGSGVRTKRDDGGARCISYLGSITGLSYTLAELIVIVPELSGFKTTGPYEVRAVSP